MNWQRGFRCPGPPSAPPTRCCGSRAGWTPGADPGADCGCRQATRRVDGSSAPSTAAATFGAGGIFGWQDGIGWHEAVPASADPPATIDLTTACLPAPAEPLAAAVPAAAEQLSRYTNGDGYLPFGLPVLREVIAARYAAAGVPTTAEQILVTSGAQHAFTLILGELSAPGDRVLIECPTYPVALDALRAGRRIPAPVGLAEPRPLGSDRPRVPGTSIFSLPPCGRPRRGWAT